MRSKLVSKIVTIFLASFVVLLTVSSAAIAADGTYMVYWGTDNSSTLQSPPTNGTGGSVTSSPSITRGASIDYTGSNTITFTISPTSGYSVSSIRARRTQSNGTWNNWYTMENSNVSMVKVNGNTIILDTAQYSSVWRNFEIAVIFAADSSSSSSGTFKINWGTDGSNGSGGNATSTSYTISRGSATTYNGTETIEFNLAPTSGYSVSSVRARRTQSNGNWNNWYTLNDSNVSSVVLNGTSTSITFNTAQISSSYRNFEIEVTFATNTVNVSWGTDTVNGTGGTVTSTGRDVVNTQNVSPSFTPTSTASFTLNPDAGNTVTKVEYKRSDWNNWSNVPNWSSGDSTFAFAINSKNWSVKVTFHTPANVTNKIISYYGTSPPEGTTPDFSVTPPNWIGGNVYRGSSTQIGTAGYNTYSYSDSNNTRTVRIIPDSGYKIVSVKWVVATWSNPANISWTGSFTDAAGLHEDGNTTAVTLPTTKDTQFSLTTAHPDSYLVWVVFAPVGAVGGTVGAWYGTNNSTGYDTPQANGSGGTVYKTSGTTQLLANRDPNGSTIATDSTVTFQARASSGFKVTKIWFGQPDPIAASSIDVSAATVGGTVTFTVPVSGGNTYKIWVIFSSLTALRQVSGTIDSGSNAACTSSSVSPTPQVVTDGATASFTLSTSSNCMIDCINFNSVGCTPTGNGTVSGNTYTTPAITTSDKSFTVKFKPVGFDIVSERDATSPSGCGTISPVGTNNYTKGTNATYTITAGAACMVSHVWVKDTNVGLTTATDIAPISGGTYTFQDIQAAGSIKVQFTEVIPTSADSYCQIPPFVAGQSGLAPNVLIIFDNSGSMGGTMGDAYYNKKTYDCSGSSLTGCTTFYGYFDPGKMYKVNASNSSQYDIDSVTLNLAASNAKSGNYLNYRYMDKVDVIRKALMGGKVVDRAATTKYLKSNVGKTIEYGPDLPTGIVQRLSGKVRFGMMVFNDPPEGGRLANVPNTTPARKTVLGASEADLIAAMESTETDPKTNTPISETLYEAIRYYQHKPSAYNTGVDYSTMVDPIQNNCQKHFILLLTDGEPNSNNNLPGLATQPTKNGYTDVYFNVTEWENRIPVDDRANNNNSSCFTNTYKCPAGSTNNCSTNSEKVEAVAFYMHSTDLRTDKEGMQNITLFPVYAFGDGTGTKTLHMAAKYGGFDNKNGNLPSPNTWPSPDEQVEWDKDTDCKPDNYFEADNGSVLETNIMAAMSNILAKVSSGTAASILSNSEGSGANLLQAVFYPNKIFKNSTEANWIGEMQNLWYYVDPFVANSTVREDTDFATTTPDHILNLKNDYVTSFIFNGTQTTASQFQDTNGDGKGETAIAANVDPDDVKSIWRAGKQLWLKDASSRTIYTSLNGVSLLSGALGGFHTDNKVSLVAYLQAANNDSGTEAGDLISYIRGDDNPVYRNRTVSILTTAPSTYTTKSWKLGDIVASTPKLQSSVKLNNYDADSPSGYGDYSYKKFIATLDYQNRGMVYVGANDGMFHAFKLGTLSVTGSGITGDVKAKLTGTNLGEEQWAYIPRNALPYLKYFTDRSNYKHLYYVDGPTLLADVAIGGCGGGGDYSLCVKDTTAGSNWRTIVIGSMGLGGASKLKDNTSCTSDIAAGTCVKTPIFDPTDVATPKTKGIGFSSYFAFDVTNQHFSSGTLPDPVFKWEFSHPDMGYATSGAAIVKINAKETITANGVSAVKEYPEKNGKWFAVFASGPTGPIEVSSHKFYAKSDQNLRFFVIDLGATIDSSHPFTLDSNYWVLDSTIANAFGGTITNAVIDTDRWKKGGEGNFEDDVLYAGYTNKNTTTNVWSSGGIVRLLTKGSTNPKEWAISQVVKDVGPVTTSVAKLQDRKAKKLWLYFGTGRYFYSGDDSSTIRHIVGVQDGCYTINNNIDKNCDTSSSGAGKALTLSDLTDQSSSCSTPSKGWYIPLRTENTNDLMSAERIITDPVALTSGTVYYTSFSPTSDPCSFGGSSYMWALKFDNGCLPQCSAMNGKGLLQLSTGSFQELNFSDIFSCTLPDGTTKPPTITSLLPTLSDGSTPPTPKEPTSPGTPYLSPPSPPMIGKPPGAPPAILDPFGNSPLKKVIHIKEK